MVVQCIYWQGVALSPKTTLWLYKRAINPRITYAAVALWDIMDTALASSEWDCLQRVACIMITGAMRTTPTKVLQMLLDLPTLGMAVGSAALDPGNLGTRHNLIWAKADKVNRKFSIIKE